MAYNREWDQGKAWETGQSWNAPNAHAREDDYYAEGKRRKMNAGVRCPNAVLALCLNFT
jgi:hypothetical protein